MRVVIFSGGKVRKSKSVTDCIKQADLIIAADQGAKSALDLGVVPSTIIGDFDSLSQTVQDQLKKKGSHLISYNQEKDETDTGLALDYAIKNSATKITILGGNEGDRFDHVIANLFLSLGSSVPVQFINGSQVSQIFRGPVSFSLNGKTNDLLSLVPLASDVENISTENLKWELRDGTLSFGRPRGVSNVFLQNVVKISFKKGLLLVVHTLL